MLDGRGVDQDTVKELVVLRGIATLIGLGATIKGKQIIRVFINKLLSTLYYIVYMIVHINRLVQVSRCNRKGSTQYLFNSNCIQINNIDLISFTSVIVIATKE